MFSPKSLGYDRSLTIFSPDGRLYQVEYANEAVRRGASCIGLVAKDGVVIIAQRKIDLQQRKLLAPQGLNKIFAVDDEILLSGAGLLGDLQWFVSYSRLQAQNLVLTYGETTSPEMLVKNLANLMLLHTQIAGYRPWGVSLILAGIYNDIPQIFLIEPSGSYWRYNGLALGESMVELNEYLEKSYNADNNLEQQILLGINAFKHVNPNINEHQLEIVQVTSGQKISSRLSEEFIKKYFT